MELPERKSRCSQDCRCHGTSHVCAAVSDMAREGARFKGLEQPLVPVTEAAPACAVPAARPGEVQSLEGSASPAAWEEGSWQCAGLDPVLTAPPHDLGAELPCRGETEAERDGSQTWVGSFAKIAEGEAVPTAESCSRAWKPFTWHLIIY